MSETSATLAFFTEGWHYYQALLTNSLAQLTPAQLALRAAPTQRTIHDLACHIIAARSGWLHYNLAEGDESLATFASWDAPNSPPHSASEIVHGLEQTWQVIQNILEHYTLSDLQSTIQDDWNGQTYTLTHGWVIWHLIELDLHHGGEITQTLRIHNLPSWQEGGKRG